MTIAPEAATDPVCGMTVDPSTAAASIEYEGRTYYFCSHHCHKSFAEDPARYVTTAHEHGAHDHGAH